MEAWIRTSYGLGALKRVGLGRRSPADGEVVVRVHAASLNRIDWYHLTGTPLVIRPTLGVRRPRLAAFQVDVAGTVVATGANVTQLAEGDRVFGRAGPFGEYVTAEHDAFARMPANSSFATASALPTAGRTALQALRDAAGVQPGQTVLVNGASGAVGTFVVQIAKALGTEVTAVCSARNVEQARRLGAAHVVDYERTNFTRLAARYDVAVDIVGSRSWRELRRVLAPEATLVLVGGPNNPLLGPLVHIARIKLRARLAGRRAAFFIAKPHVEDLDSLGRMVEAGEIDPVIECEYPFAEACEALRWLGEGHARGKIVVTLIPDATAA